MFIEVSHLGYFRSPISSVHPRWLVKFEATFKDEEVYEHLFVKIESVSGSQSDSSRRSPLPGHSTERRSQKTSSTSPTTDEEAAALNETKDIEDSGYQQQKKKKGTSLSPVPSDSSPDGSRQKSTNELRKISAREQRSKRRQEMLDEFGKYVIPNAHPYGTGKSKEGLTRKGGNPTKGGKRSKQGNSSECLKIKLLTGTLYLHRGRNRRAEFVRRV